MSLNNNGPSPVTDAEFARLMQSIGPWVPDRPEFPVAVAVSGGADSLCLAILARAWRRAIVAFVVDHGLRSASRVEAERTCARLASHDIPAVRLDLAGLTPGPGVQARARKARYAALTAACIDHGCVDLLLGHHARDQAETVLIRKRARSGPDGLAGMATVMETPFLRMIRPLLGVTPERLRARLSQNGIPWIEDPSNGDPRYERVRIRARLTPARTGTVNAIAAIHGRNRMERSARVADELASSVMAHPAGWMIVPRRGVSFDAWNAILQSVTGSPYRIGPARIAHLHADRLRPLTVGNARIVAGGRYGDSWIVQREQGDGGLFRKSDTGLSHADWKFLPATIRATLPALEEAGTEFAAPQAATDESRWG